jgi:phosphatidylglycerophosphate synthase
MDNQSDKNEDHFAQDHIYSGNRKEPYIKAISYLVFGLFFVGAGIVNFLRIRAWEHAGGQFEMNVATELMYKTGGKWLILIFMSALGIIIIRKGYLLWRRIKAQEKI